MLASTPAFGSFHQTNSAGLNYSSRRSTLSQMFHNRRKRNCFSLELMAEIINAVDMKRKTKAQIYRDYKYNINMFAWNTLFLLERQRSHETQSKAHDTL